MAAKYVFNSTDTFELETDTHKSRKKGCFVSTGKAVSIVAVVCILIAGAVLITYFAMPVCEDVTCEAPTDPMPEPDDPDEQKGEPFEGRLPDTLVPSMYTVKLQPFLDEEDGPKRFSFDGSVEIVVRAEKATNVITLHAHPTLQIDPAFVSVTSTSSPQQLEALEISRTERDDEYEFFKIVLSGDGLQEGQEYAVKLDSFTGTLHHDDFQGLYLSNYTEGEDSQLKHLVATQFETTNTRRAFPCFDEPNLKARFEVSIKHRSTRVALCNMPEREDGATHDEDNWVTTTFYRTNVLMPTYLIAIVVADFGKLETTTANGIQFRVWSRKEEVHALDYSLHTGSDMLTFFEDYWNIGYPLPKLDMVAVPDFYFGAMENWGLVIYRESRLLYDPKVNTLTRKQRVAGIIAHELAHMWFGNLVTLDWWDHVWLNEGFATFYELPSIQAVEPTWDVYDQFHARWNIQPALDYDGSWTSHPAVRPVGWPDDIWSQFSTVSYSKGACLIMMMETFLGNATLKTGLQNYLNKYSYTNAVSDELFAELTEADRGKKDTDVKKIMDPWTLQMGYPVVSLSREGNVIKAEQTRFIADPNEESNDKHYDMGYKWYVPLTFTDQTEMLYNNPSEAWMNMASAEFDLSESATENDWYLVNVDYKGFYRVKYENENWDKLARHLKDEDHSTIPVRTRAQLLEDSFSIANAHQMDQVYSIKLLEYLSKETDHIPWYTAIKRLAYTRDMLKRSSAYGYLEKLVRSLINGIYFDKHWDFNHEDLLTYYKQIDAINTACYYGHQDCIDNAIVYFNRWLDRPGDTSVINDDVADTVFCTAIKNTGGSIWEEAWNLYVNGTLSSGDVSRLQSALACTNEQWTLERYMEHSLERSETKDVIKSVLQNSAIGFTLAWEFVINHWDDIHTKYGDDAYEIVWMFVEYMNTEADLMKFEAFGKKYHDMPGPAARVYYNSIDRIQTNIDWMTRNYDQVYNQLLASTRDTDEPADDRGPFEGHLPDALQPSLYDVTITPYLDEEDGEKRFTFDGSVSVTFEAAKATRVIVLHAHGTLDVVESSISVAPLNQPSHPLTIDGTDRVDEYEFLRVHLTADLQQGTEYVITIETFTGTLHHADFLGLYLSNYTEGVDNQQRNLASTQFAPTAARRAFPCFDEPALKAKFDVTIVHRNSRVALCNMPMQTTEENGDWNTTVFERTSVVMSTYLVAMVVADFGSVEMVSPSNTLIRVWSRKEMVPALNYALHICNETLTYMENYYGIEYKLPKEDMIAIPDFYFGAMENWGLITYRESRLLYDPDVNTEYRKHGVAAVIAHELVHMWFGNLVTMAWWNHTWLNEGFASYYEYPALEVTEPTWDAFNQFHPRDDLYRALDYDDSWSSHPQINPVGWPDEILNNFDTIAYPRGSALNRMMQTFLGEETFIRGLRSYLNKYQYSNTVSEQLFAELTEADVGFKDTDVGMVMDTWTLQMGYPIITLTREGSAVHAEQKRFIMDPNEEPNDKYYDMGYKWHVPLTFTDQSEMEFSNPHEKWMDMGPADFNLSTSFSGDDWYLVNIDHNGLYRVKYENDNWDKLATFLKSEDHTTIPVRTRAQLIEESFSIAHAHQMDQVYSIKLLEYLSKETEYIPWYAAILRHGYTRDMLKRTAAYGYLESLMRTLVNNNYWNKYWSFNHGEHLAYYKQIDAIKTACYYGHEDCVSNAKTQFEQWLDDPEDMSLIHDNVRATVYCTAIKYSAESVWERAWSLYDSGSVPSDERSNLRSALACSKEPWILERYMAYAMEKNEANSVIPSVLANSPSGYALALDFAMANWNTLKESHGSSAYNIIWEFADYMTSEADLMKLEEFGRKNQYVPNFPATTYGQTVDKVKLNVQWMDRNYEAVYQQLIDATTGTEPPPEEREEFDGRLPETLEPSLYAVTVKPYLDEEDGEKRFTFDGSVDITFKVLSSTDVIVLHAHSTLVVNSSDSMIIVGESDDFSQRIEVDRVEIVEKYEFIKIYLVSQLQQDTEYLIKIKSFTGTLHHADFQGMYLSNYTEGENSELKHMVATQLETTNTRRVFPCFDEPALKAQFDMTVVHRQSRVALCNMPVHDTCTGCEWKTTRFQRTSVVMPTYLLAIVVADFESVEMQTPNNITMRLWSRPEAVPSLNYSLHVGSAMLTFFEDYWGIDYPLPKEDMVAIPDFYFGAMENWGLILYRETALLYDPEENTQYRKHGVAAIIAHELAHMWFGNLVTLEWWDHVWLNEGYASFYEYPALEAVEPSWDAFDQFHPRDDLHRALDADDTWSSHPVVRPVGWPDVIWSQFDRIAYQRGSCLNMMMETFLGKDTFKTGLQNYLHKYEYSNAVSDDLFAELTLADVGKKDTDVKMVMDTWILQMGYPIVTLTRDGDVIHAEQERFIMDPNEEPNDNYYDMGYKWHIPLTYTDQQEMQFEAPHETWMNMEAANFTLMSPATADDWYLVNIDNRGFYRVKYENDNWEKLATFLKDEDHTAIPVRTRSQLLEEAFSIANAHQMDQVYSIKLLEYLSKETEYIPWYTAILRHGYTRDMLKRTAAYGYFEAHIRSLINSIYWEKRWDFTHDEHVPYYKQIDALKTACYYGHQDCVESSQTQFGQWLDNPEDTSRIHVNIKDTVYCTAIKYGTEDVWETTWSLYDSENVPSGERGRIRSALACSDKQWIIQRYLEYALAKNEANSVIGSVLRNSAIGYTMALEFTLSNWDALREAHENSAFDIVWQFADYMNTYDDLKKLEEFGRMYQYVPGFPDKTFESTVAKVKLNIQWMKRNYEAVYQQLMDATTGTEPPPEEREEFDGRLPETLEPSLYAVTVQPYLDEEDGEKRFTFDGSVEITFDVMASTDIIVLHAHNTLKVDDSDSMITVEESANPSQTIAVDRVEVDVKYEFVKIYLASPLQMSTEYIIRINAFTGTLHHADFQGMYLSNYTEGGNNDLKHLVATQLETTNTRRVFPCFDEPALKAQFDMTVVHRPSRVALCNMPEQQSSVDGGWKTTVFQRTAVVMPTYLLAIVVADFESVEMQTPNNITMRLWSRPEAVPSLNYSLHAGSAMLTFFEDYWGIDYPLPKEDMVAIPDFYFGAMENWGLILYRETALLYDPEENTQYRKHGVAAIIAHELAHMWFGNLVTLEWWDHVWLNEGYASFYEYPALEAVEPSWDAFDQFHPRDDLHRALDADDTWSSHPVVRPVGWPDVIWSQFDRIAYQRGSCLNMMMETFLGKETFKTGLQNYLHKYEYSNAVSDDLFAELTMADVGKKDTDVKMVMDTWILQMGYPIVTLTRDGDVIHAEQERFIMDPNEEPNDNYYDMGYKWYIPITYTDRQEMAFDSPHETWMDMGPANFTLMSSATADDWYLVNIDNRGFYRVKYENDNWEKLARFLRDEDHTAIPVRTRSQLLEEAFSIANAHQMDQVYSIKLLEYLSKETEYIPWYTAILRHGYTRDMLKRTAAYGYLEEHLRSLINSIYWEKRWDFSHDEHVAYYKQVDAIKTACFYGHQDCVENAKAQFNQWLDNPEDTSVIHVNIKSTVYCTAIKYGTEDVWETTWSLYDSENVPSGERGSIRSALACSDKQWIIQRYLEYALSKNQANNVIGDVLRNSAIGYTLALEFTLSNWDALRQAHGSGAFSIVWQFGDFMNTYEDLVKLEDFGNRYQYSPGFSQDTYKNTVDKVKLNIQWMERNFDAVYQQLVQATNDTEVPVEREPFDGRLPETLKPSFYTVSIKPYLDEEDGERRFSFDGSVEITFEVMNATNVIILHAHDTMKVNASDSMITVATVGMPSQTVPVDRVEVVEKYEFVKIYLISDLQEGLEYTVTIDSFTGTLLHSDLQGLYLSNYTDTGDPEIKRAIATQFESTLARRAFPCFDEPQLKAFFQVTIIHRNSRVALCNMPVVETNQDGDWNTTVFDTTSVVMPTYLIAIVVADFGSLEMTTANNVTFRVWARKELVPHLNYSLHVGSEMLTYFEDYYEIPYPLPKEDMVAVPDFASGAMENWGLILYRESLLVYDPGYNSHYRKHSVAAVIAHELAHMWFGNHVTMEWWDHLWLNEGFASYLECPPLEVVEPTWQMFDQFHPRDDMYRALEYDDSWSSRPTVRPVGWNDEIDGMFDRIAYQRGSSLIMMMKTFLGEDTLKIGLQNYLNKYENSNAESHDLFAELTKADEGKKNTDVQKVMDTWTLQMGYPIVTVTRDGDVIHAEQKRFIMDPNEEPNNNYYDMGYKWYVYLTYTDQSEMEFDTPHNTWMEMGPANFTLTSSSSDDWYLVNLDHRGFYRVLYENDNWDKLATFLKEQDHTTIPVRTRSQLLEEAFSMAHAHQMDQVYSIKLLEYLSKETDYLPWFTAVARHGYTRDMLKRTAAYGYLEEHLRSLISNQYWEKRWDFSHDDHLSYYKQMNAIETACYYGHQDCVDSSISQFRRWLDNPQDTSFMHINIKDTVYCTAIQHGTEEDWERAWSLYDSGNMPSGERTNVRWALSCSKEQWIINRYMQYALEKRETNTVIGYVLRNSPIGYSLAWEFTMANWDALREAHGNSAFNIVWQFSDFMNTATDLMQLEEFGRKNQYTPGFAKSTYDSNVDKVKLNIQWMERNYDAVYQQLVQATDDTEVPVEREPFDGRLPETLKPSFYTVSIKPYLDEEDGERRFSFDGSVEITFEVMNSTNVIILHAHDTMKVNASDSMITVATVGTPSQTVPVDRVEVVEKYEFVKIYLISDLQEGLEYTVTIDSFTGTLLHSDLQGLYLSNYTDTGDPEIKRAIATQFESTLARRAFPCFDEPQLKAFFQVTIIHRNSRVALCNMPVVETSHDGDWNTTVFDTTSVVMPTYLIAIVVADFGSLEMTTANNVTFRVWARKELVPHLNYSLHVGSEMLTYFEDYYEIPYPLPKEDMVAVPDFASGAMENWGLILYRESLLVYDPGYNSHYRKHSVAAVIAHELAHMWFGNHVTMKWWDHLWLNEGFASYLECPPLEVVEPTWQMFDQFHPRDDMYRALEYDDSWSSRPTVRPVGWNDEIDGMFDRIAYQRGSSLIMMMKTFLGEDTLKTGLQNYLNKYENSNAESHDLFAELTKADEGKKNTDVQKVMDTWTLQMGYPIVTVTRDGNFVHAEQKRFIMDPNEEPNNNYYDMGYKWYVYLTYTDQSEMEFDTPHNTWMEMGPANFTLTSSSSDDWYLVNLDHRGFYRVLYENDNWDKLATFLKEQDHTTIPVRTRSQLLEEAFSIAHAHQMDQVYSIKLLEYLSKETEYLPWFTAVARHGYTRDMLKRTAAYGYLEEHLRSLISNQYWEQRWDFSHDDHLSYYKQMNAIETACYYGHQDCVDSSISQFRRWLDNPQDTSFMHINIKDTVYCTAIQHGTEEDWERAWILYDSGNMPSGERTNVRWALSCSKEPWIINRYMQYALEKRETNTVIGYVLRNSPIGYSLAWEFTMANWDALREAHGNSAFSIVWQFADFMNTGEDLEKLEEFGRKNQYTPGFTKSTYDSNVDKVKLNIQWMERNFDAVYQQLVQATNYTEVPVEREPFDGRLPETLKPSVYAVTIQLYLDEEDGEKRFSFDGSIEVTFDVLSSTNLIVLHAHDTLKVNASTVTVAESLNPTQTVQVDRVETEEKYEFVKFYLAGDLSEGVAYTISIDDFTGTVLHTDLYGIYLSNYTDGDSEIKHAIGTQFESTFARRAFPCFDEPQLKAYFDVTIIHRPSRVALCNMPVLETSHDGGWNTTVYETTSVVMPTYLIAIVVADFGSLEMTTQNNKTMRVWGRKEVVSHLNYALEVGSDMLTFFENHFEIEYTLPKEDMVAMPTFASGAMENWGLILYREIYLTYDPETNTHYRKHIVAEFIAHELAHMWFGNLVTLAWWDHLWLNEGFASFYEFPPIDAVETTWQMDDQFQPREILYSAFDTDDSWSSRPTVRRADWPDEIDNMFDRIAYQRGGALIMMMQTFLGEETLRIGLRNYLNEYENSNTVTHDLFAELTKADVGKKNTDVQKVMDTWTLQMGYPIITVTRDGNFVHAEQRRFIMDPNEEPNNNYYDMGYKWYVPLTYTDQGEMAFDSPHETWMDMGPANFTLTSSSSDDWYLVNLDHRGFYRVLYENDNWDKLATFLKEQDHTTIPVRTRSQLLEEAFSIAHAHQMDQVYSIKLMEYLSKETEYLPWYTAVRRIAHTRDMVKRTAAYGYLEEHMRSLINNQYWGGQRWDFNHDDHLTYYKQMIALETACYYGHQDCIDSAKSQFTRWLDNPEDTSMIHVNIRDTVYCTAIKYGTEDVWEAAWSLYDSGNVPSDETRNVQIALACSKEQWIIKRYLEYALAKKNANTAISDVLNNSPFGYSLAWEFTMANWDALRAAHGNGAFSVVWQFTDYMNTDADLANLEEFGRKNQYTPGFTKSTYDSHVDKVKLNIQWMERNYDAVYQQLVQATNYTEVPVEREQFDGRLLESLKPSHYDVTIKPYLDEEDGEKRFSFDGSVAITFDVSNETDLIILHAHDTMKVNASDSMITVENTASGQTTAVDRVEIIEKYEFVKIHLVSELQRGNEYRVTINLFTGTLHHADFRGLYLSNYTEGEDNQLKHAIGTQFESTFARRAFPCFDEPQLKAYFDVTIIHRPSRVALCNMPVMETSHNGGWNTTVYETTSVVMPTYLIAIVVADFGSLEMTTPNNITMRVWARKELVPHLNYSLHVGSAIMTYFEDYFEIPYPLPKEDMVAVPDFASGAMENWGLILYRESYLVYDPEYHTQYRKHGVAFVVAHELAHMWFGNHVTMEWWDHLWLNEGFASYLECPPLEVVEPSWQMFDQFQPREDLYPAFDFDDSWSSHPTVRPLGWPDEIRSQFDRIAYQRGSSLIMMMRTFLGEDTLKTGLQNYLNEHENSNTVSHDLFAELTKADEGKKDTDVQKVMDTWTLQMGYPIITVTRDGNFVHAEQKRFIMDPNEEPNNDYFDMGYKWYVHLTYTDQGEMGFDSPHETWMNMGPANFTLTSSSSDDWYLVNVDHRGYYRVLYDNENWDKLATFLKDGDHSAIPVRTRSQLLEEAFSIANAHQMDQVYSIKLLEYLSKETETLPWYTAILRHGYTRDMVKRTAAFGYLERHMRYLINNSYWELEWDFSHDLHLQYYKQIDAIKTACYYGHGHCTDMAKVQFSQWLANINDTESIHSNVKDTVYCTAVKYGSENLWEEAWSLYDNDRIPADERTRMRSALACSKEQWILERYMEYALSKNEADSVIGSVLQNSGFSFAWDFAINNWDALKEAHGNGAFSIVWQFADYMNTELDLLKLQAFGNKYQDMPGFTTSSYQAAVDKVKLNIQWMQRNYQPVYQQLKDATRNYQL